jgi:hypothetical protein
VDRLDDRSARDGATATATLAPLTRDLLIWVARRPRSYAETMEAWRTSCPRFPIWEDALGDGLVRVERGDGARLSEARVVLTPRGHAVLGAE